MSAKVIALFRKAGAASDWTPAETAELYRIEHALLQARFSIQTDRGVTDEGDPWFVFCRSDGEVVVHVTRFDGEYQVHSPGLPVPLRGRSFVDLSKSFVSHLAIQVPVTQDSGAKLFVHPAAMLAVIIGTIFAALDDNHLIGCTVPSSECGESTSDSLAKSVLHDAVRGIFDLLGHSPAADNAELRASYLNAMAVIAAVVIGASYGMDSPYKNENPQIEVAIGEGGSEPAAVTQHIVIDESGSSIADLPFSPMEGLLTHPAAAYLSASHQQIEDQQNEGHQIAEQWAASDYVVGKPHTPDFADKPEALRLGNVEGWFREDGIEVLAPGLPTKFQVTGGVARESNLDLSHLGGASVQGKVSSTVGFVEGGVSSPVHSVVQLPVDLGLVGGKRSEGQQAPAIFSSQEASEILPSNEVAVEKFDAAAMEFLISFWKEHPAAYAIYGEGNTTIVDGVSASRGAALIVVKEWEVPSGATIKVVGHVDHPEHA